jgi:hypothetical protein
VLRRPRPGLTQPAIECSVDPSQEGEQSTASWTRAATSSALSGTLGRPDGKPIDPAFDGFLTGRGTDTLVVGGFPVRLDGTALDHGLYPMIAGSTAFLMPDHVHELTLTPSAQYGLQPGSGLVANFHFGVDRDGHVIVPAQFGSFASGDGTDTVTIAGFTVTIDGRSLSHDLFPMLPRLVNDFLPRTTTNPLTLIPAAGYGFQPGSGIVADLSFTLGTDGLLDFPASCDGFMSGRGTSTLQIGGYPLLVDATQADSELLTIANIPIPADTPRFLFAVLVPATGYQPQTAKRRLRPRVRHRTRRNGHVRPRPRRSVRDHDRAPTGDRRRHAVLISGGRALGSA